MSFSILLPLHTIVSIEIAIISNFILNNLWTFKDQSIKFNQLEKLIFKFLQFNFVSLGSLIIQSIVFVIGIKILGSSFLKDNFYTIFGILIGLIWNYTMYTRFIWKTKDKN